MKRRAPETDVARAAIAWLEADGWDVYQEVKHGGSIADIVATRADELAVVECKTSLCFTVLAQARRWKQYSNQVWVAIPQEHKDYDTRCFAHAVCEWAEIGVYATEGRVRYGERPGVVLDAPSRLRRFDMLKDALRPEHKTFAAAGSPNGSVFSAFRGTCTDVAAWLREHPGATVTDIVGELGKMHYASLAAARSSLLDRGKRGVLHGIRVEQDGRRCRFYAEVS